MLKKMMLLAGAALAVVAFAAPAAQATFTHNGVPITGEVNTTLKLTGHARFDVPSAGSSFGCDVHVTLTITGGTDADVTQFEPTTGTCSGTGPLFSGCELVADQNTSFPWTAKPVTSNRTITIEDVTIDNTYANCPVPSSALNLHVTATPNNPAAIESVELSGGSAGVVVTGELEVGEGSGTYGIAGL